MRLLGWLVMKEAALLALQRKLEGREGRLADLRAELLSQQESIRMLVAENHRLRNTPEFPPYAKVEMNALHPEDRTARGPD